MSGGTERLLDALERVYRADDRPAPQAVLMVATEHSAEALPGLLELFAAARLTIIGARSELIDSLRQRQGAHAERVTLVRGSVSDLADLVPGPYDLAIVRQPDISVARAAWRFALQACAHALTDGGLFLLTTGLLPDAGFVDEQMQALPLTMLPGSPYTPVPVALTGIDRYIMFYERQ